jgi:predicted membrane protein
VTAKFYTLNSFLILIVLTAATKLIYNNTDFKQQIKLACLISYIIGLGSANHHTIFFLLLPIGYLAVVLRHKITLKAIPYISLSFLLGFVVNVFILIRGSGNNFFSSVYVRDISDALSVFLRSHYGPGSSISATKHILSDYPVYIAVLKSFLTIIIKNLGLVPTIFAGIGVLKLLKQQRSYALFLILALASYGPLLAKITMGSAHPIETDYYIAAHQYFLPALAISAVFAGVGFTLVSTLLDRLASPYVSNLALWLLCLVPVTSLFSRCIDSNYKTNFVPYQVAKESLSILPLKSVFLTYGDNPIYQTWYLKLVARYRDDVCQICASEQESPVIGYQGCNSRIYSASHAQVYEGRITKMQDIINEGKFFTSDPLHNHFYFKDLLQGEPISLVTLVTIKEQNQLGLTRDPAVHFKLKTIREFSDRILDPTVCLEHKTDDLYTRGICSKYVTSLIYSSKQYSSAEYGDLGKDVTLTMPLIHNNIIKGVITETVRLTEANKDNLFLATKIAEYNNWHILYTR